MAILVKIFDKFRLTLNEGKTETMNFGPIEIDYPQSFLSINDKPIKNVKQFKFLGSTIKFNEINTGEYETSVRIETAKYKFAEMKRLLLNYNIKLATSITVLSEVDLYSHAGHGT